MFIRKATIKDLKIITAVEQECFPAAEAATEGEAAAEIKLITEDTQLTYKYTDENKEDGRDDSYTVYAEFGADAKLPEGVELSAEEITIESDPEAYEAYYEKALSGLQDKYDGNTALSFARFYDIRFIYNGQEVEPAGDVKIRIEYRKAVEIEKETNVDAVHFDKNNGEEPEVIESEVNRTEDAEEEEGKDDTVMAVEFESAQFSVYGILGSYTVDFRWEVDGRTYDFSMPGGGFVSFTDLKGQEPYDEPYYLAETKAPDGYYFLAEPLKVSIDLADHNTWGRYTAAKEYSEDETYYVFNEETYEYEEADISSKADITGSDVTVFRFVPRSQSKPDPYELSDWLQEAAVKVTAPDGTDSSSAIRVIPEGQHGITFDHTDDTTDASVEYMIVNNAGHELPYTGGPGTDLIYFLGVMLTGVAGAGLLMRWKKKAA